MSKFELITFCNINGFYEVLPKDKEVLAETLAGKEYEYKYNSRTNVGADRLREDSLYDICFIDNDDNGIHKIYQSLSKREALKIYGLIPEYEKSYANIFPVKKRVYI